MSFYLKAPRGDIMLHTLETCIEERLQLLRSIDKGDEIRSNNINYLGDHSAVDRVGHFVLRVKAMFDSDFKRFFIRNEKKFFLLRLSFYKPSTLHKTLRVVLRHCNEILKNQTGNYSMTTFLIGTITLCETILSRKGFIEHLINHSNNCEEFRLIVPFQLCLHSVSNLEVSIERGFANFPCRIWNKLLADIFETHLLLAFDDHSERQIYRNVMTDERIRNIINRKEDSPKKTLLKGSITFENIDREVKYFPLCMLNLHLTLRKNHRLSHNGRFYLTLFLKDAGMDVSDAIQYWRTEYTKEHSKCSKCSHDWESNEKKYLYDIRHMYGLEGSRKNYASHSCIQIQSESNGPTSEIYCPFKNSDTSVLRRLIFQSQLISEDCIQDILTKRTQTEPTTCCEHYLDVIRKETKGFSYFKRSSRPTMYYKDLALLRW